MKKFLFLIAYLLLSSHFVSAQFFQIQQEFTRQDTLRGSITPERAWWDVTYYHLDVTVDLEDSTISGSNKVQYEVLEKATLMQIDLQEPMYIERIIQDGEELQFVRDSSVFFINLKKNQVVGSINELTIYFDGKPKVAVNPPWDGGITWTKDNNDLPFVASANQGIGASVWWPNKEHAYDEVDSMLISVTIPGHLMDISNGRLRSVDENKDGTKTWNWFVNNPINNYGVNINIGDYVHFGEIYAGEKGELDMDYYVLRDNLEKAIAQFADAPRSIEAFEYWFGPYPFYEDSYKLVEAPYLGMEHQSSVTYGNGYQNGYLGRDWSGTGWGLKFDYIIIHETGHEWFANSITSKDVADLWIHESFTFYSEALFLEYHFGKEAGAEYMRGTRFNIVNDRPIIGVHGVNYGGSRDVYFKGGSMLHTLRQVVDSDSLWRAALRGLNNEFYHKTVEGRQVEEYLGKVFNLDLTPFFDQYLRDNRLPVLEYAFRDGALIYRWGNVKTNFDMPVDVIIDGKTEKLFPKSSWQQMDYFGKELIVDPDFYVGSMNLFGN